MNIYTKKVYTDYYNRRTLIPISIIYKWRLWRFYYVKSFWNLDLFTFYGIILSFKDIYCNNRCLFPFIKAYRVYSSFPSYAPLKSEHIGWELPSDFYDRGSRRAFLHPFRILKRVLRRYVARSESRDVECLVFWATR